MVSIDISFVSIFEKSCSFDNPKWILMIQLPLGAHPYLGYNRPHWQHTADLLVLIYIDFYKYVTI